MLSDGGYIDNPLRGQTDVNRVDTRGGRGTFRFDAGDGWTVDIGGVYQAITSHDAQYADKDAPPLTRHSMVAQNARSRYAMATLVVSRDWGDRSEERRGGNEWVRTCRRRWRTDPSK